MFVVGAPWMFMVPTVDYPPGETMVHSAPRFRILEIGLRSADLKISKRAKTYVNLWIERDRKLQTGVSKLVGPKPAWEEKFVFSISDNLFCRKDTSIYFAIYKARKYAPDSLVGTGRCDLNDLFGCADNEDRDQYGDGDEDGDSEKEAVYDAASDQEMEEKNSLYDDDLDDSDSAASTPARDKEEVDDVKGPPELRASTSVRVSKGLGLKGELRLDVTVWKGYINSVGGSKWRDFAMTYDGFMGNVGEKKKTKRAWTCFANVSSNKDD